MDSFLATPLEPNRFPLNCDMKTLARFRRAMGKDDQEILDDLLFSVRHHWPLKEDAAHLTPLELLLMTMMVEQRKELMDLKDLVNGT
jgi:hypothetical protein